MDKFLLFASMTLIVHVAYAQLGNLGTAVQALSAGNQALNSLPAPARDCVNKVSTKAVSDAVGKQLLTQIQGLAGSSLPMPTVERGPGQLECKGDTPYWKETSHIKGQLPLLNLPMDIPVTTETDISSCTPGPLNICKAANGLLGSNGGNMLNGILGAGNANNQQSSGVNPLALIGGQGGR